MRVQRTRSSPLALRSPLTRHPLGRLKACAGVVLVVGSAVACARADGRSAQLPFPELEVVGGLPAGFSWQFKNGPDFYVYRGTSPSEPESEVGIYFGNAPSFRPQPGTRELASVVAGHDVLWNISAGGPPFLGEALVLYRYDKQTAQIKLHIWVAASTSARLSELQEALTTARIRPRKGGRA